MSVGGGISLKDFILECIKKGYFTNDDIGFLEKTTSEIQSIELLKSKGFINDDKIFDIMKKLSLGSKIPTYENIEELEHLDNTDRGTVSLNISDVFKDAMENFGFYEKGLSIYGMDLKTKSIYALVPLLTAEYFSLLSKFKKESKFFTEKHKYLDKSGDFIEEHYVALGDFTIKIGLAHNKIIQKINKANSIEKSMKGIMSALEEENKKTGKTDTNVIEKYVLSEENGPIEGALKELFKYGLTIEASDLHFEPDLHSETGSGRIRYRAIGTLNNIIELKEGGIFNKLITTLKELCGMRTDINNLPQDGKIDVVIIDKDTGKKTELPYRVSMMPIGEKGQEKAVLRMLSKDVDYLTKEGLNMDLDYVKIIDEIVGDKKKGKTGKFHTGMILMTGPTGSGKSTSLFAILNGLNVPDVNIITLEDPIEYELPGLNQSHIKDGNSKDANSDKYTFGSGIRACMRQDPDIILIGEIRDPVTLDAAVEAASTGHMVFASLHTNNTWETLERLMGLGLELRVVSATIRLILAQRLAQFVCKDCAVEYDQVPCELEEKERREREGLRRKKQIASALMDTEYVQYLPDRVEDISLLEGVGCPQCGNKGVKGRTSIMELLPVDLEVQDFLVEHGLDASKTAVGELYRKKGVKSLYQAAMKKVLVPTDMGKKGKLKLNFDSALVASGGNMYEIGTEYMDIDDLVEFNTLIVTKKRDYHNGELDKEKKKIEIQIKALKASITEDNKEIIEKEIAEKEKKIKEINTKYITKEVTKKKTKDELLKEIEELKKGVTKENKAERIEKIKAIKKEINNL